MTFLRTYRSSLIITVVALVIAFVYGGIDGAAIALILGVLEISLSFDNAVINATVLERMSPEWQRIFLTVGMVVAVFGMRFLFPLLVVWLAAGLGPREALDLALHPPAGGASHFADGRPSYETILTGAHPQIAAFGGAFLLMLFLSFVLQRQDVIWIRPLEVPLRAIGRLSGAAVLVAGTAVLVLGEWVVPRHETATVLAAGLLGILVFLAVDGLGTLFEDRDVVDPDALIDDEAAPDRAGIGTGQVLVATGRAAFFLFVYLEVLDASFSFDGVIGAFAITSDPILITLGLGAIGAMFVRSITIHLVREQVLGDYRFLGHGAHWAIGVLAVILLVSITHEIPEAVTGLTGVVLIGASLVSSIRANRRDAALAA